MWKEEGDGWNSQSVQGKESPANTVESSDCQKVPTLALSAATPTSWSLWIATVFPPKPVKGSATGS